MRYGSVRRNADVIILFVEEKHLFVKVNHCLLDVVHCSLKQSTLCVVHLSIEMLQPACCGGVFSRAICLCPWLLDLLCRCVSIEACDIVNSRAAVWCEVSYAILCRLLLVTIIPISCYQRLSLSVVTQG